MYPIMLETHLEKQLDYKLCVIRHFFGHLLCLLVSTSTASRLILVVHSARIFLFCYRKWARGVRARDAAGAYILAQCGLEADYIPKKCCDYAFRSFEQAFASKWSLGSRAVFGFRPCLCDCSCTCSSMVMWSGSQQVNNTHTWHSRYQHIHIM